MERSPPPPPSPPHRPPPIRFLLRACLHDVTVVSSNKVHLKVPVLPPTSGNNSSTPRPPNQTEPDSLSGGANDGVDRDLQEGGDIPGGGEGEEGSAKLAGEGQAVDNWPEGRIQWKGEALTALRTPLFMVEISAVGEKGKEAFAYTQRLAAVKESALTLIDKAISSTQVTQNIFLGRPIVWQRYFDPRRCKCFPSGGGGDDSIAEQERRKSSCEGAKRLLSIARQERRKSSCVCRSSSAACSSFHDSNLM